MMIAMKIMEHHFLFSFGSLMLIAHNSSTFSYLAQAFSLIPRKNQLSLKTQQSIGYFTRQCYAEINWMVIKTTIKPELKPEISTSRIEVITFVFHIVEFPECKQNNSAMSRGNFIILYLPSQSDDRFL